MSTFKKINEADAKFLNLEKEISFNYKSYGIVFSSDKELAITDEDIVQHDLIHYEDLMMQKRLQSFVEGKMNISLVGFLEDPTENYKFSELLEDSYELIKVKVFPPFMERFYLAQDKWNKEIRKIELKEEEFDALLSEFERILDEDDELTVFEKVVIPEPKNKFEG